MDDQHPRTGTLLDRLAVRELLDAYTQGINLRDFAAVGALFAEDGVWEVLGLGEARHVEGRAAVAVAIEAAVGKYAMLMQMNHAPLIAIEGDRATAHSTINEIGMLGDGAGLFLLGNYADAIIRTGGQWRFGKRTFRARYIDRSPLGGTLSPGA